MTDLHATAAEAARPRRADRGRRVLRARGDRRATRTLGLNYFEGYFCSRGACLGKAPWSVICAAFGAFKPAVVEQAVTGGWSKTDPEPMLAARLAGAEGPAAAAARRARPTTSTQATELLYELTDGVDPSGRMLYSGLSVLPRARHRRGAAVARRRPRPRAPRRRPHRGLDRARRLDRDHRAHRAGVGHPASQLRLHPGLERGGGRRRRRPAPGTRACSTATALTDAGARRCARRSSSRPTAPSASSSTASATAPTSCSR